MNWCVCAFKKTNTLNNFLIKVFLFIGNLLVILWIYIGIIIIIILYYIIPIPIPVNTGTCLLQEIKFDRMLTVCLYFLTHTHSWKVTTENESLL